MFIEAIKKGFANCFDFKSRATRSELWYYYLFAELLTLSAIIIDGLLGFSVRSFEILIDNQTIEFNVGPILIISFFLTVIPLTALRVRRLHDTNRTGYWYLLFIGVYIISFFYDRFSLIVFLGYINLIIFWCIKSDNGQNKYGPESQLLD
tara:strand:- start:247 stop:696 length:450 start_codon:yes stop_codon:yes gene_type:complete